MDKLNQWLSLAANVGVIVGLIFLSIEISQNTQMMRASMNQSRAETAMTQAESIYNSEKIPPILVALQSGEELNPEQEVRFAGYLRAFNRNQDNLLAQYNEGLLNESLLRSIEGAVIVEVVRLEYTRKIWERSKLTYSDDYISLVDQLITSYCKENEC